MVNIFKQLKTIVFTIMFINIVLIFTILRSVKDALIVSTINIPIVNNIGIIITMCIIFLLYIKSVKYFNNITILYIIVISFIFWFFIYVFYFDTMNNFNIVVSPLSENLILKLKYILILLMRQLPSILFYAMAELWGIMLMLLIFWQLVEQISTKSEIKITFPIYAIFGQIGIILAGLINIIVSSNESLLIQQKWLKVLVIVTVLSGIIICICMKILTKYYCLVNYNKIIEENNIKLKYKKINKFSIFQNFKYIFASKYIFLIVLLIFCYNFAINISDFMWKKYLELYSNNSSVKYILYQGKIQILTSISILFFALIFYFLIFNKKKLHHTSIITVIIVGITGGILLTPAFMYCVIIVHMSFLLCKDAKLVDFHNNDKNISSKIINNIGGQGGKILANTLKVILLFMYPLFKLYDIIWPMLIAFFICICLWIFTIRSIQKER